MDKGRLRQLASPLTVGIILLFPTNLLAYDLQHTIGLSTYLREFVAAGAGACTLALLILYRRWRGRMKRLVEQRNEMALAVMLRTREIWREKDTIQRQKQQIEELLEKAQQSNRLKDEFLANMSHEIRTPLHGVIGMTDLVLQTELTPDQREYLELAESSAKSLLSLLNDVLDFSKIEAGALTLECAPFSIRDCIQLATTSFPVVAEKKGLQFHIDIQPNVPESIEGDELRLRQVLVNLISNALKFTSQGYIRLNVSIDPSDGRLVFQVQDTGIGISKAHLDAVFEPFRQADGSTTRKYGGTGLGLSICVRLARQMGGELTLESEEGKGSTFTLRLPNCQPAQTDSKPEMDYASREVA